MTNALIFLLLPLLAIGQSVYVGWNILSQSNYSIPIDSVEIASDANLIINSNNSIYIASIHNPTLPISILVDNLNGSAKFSYNMKQEHLIYIDKGYLKSLSVLGPQVYSVPSFQNRNRILKIGNIVYFCFSFLYNIPIYKYNLSSGERILGPYLKDRSSTTGTQLAYNSNLGLLFLADSPDLMIVDRNLNIYQRLSFSKGNIEFIDTSPTGIFLVVMTSGSITTLFKLNQNGMYEERQLFTFSTPYGNPFEAGITCDEENYTCNYLQSYRITNSSTNKTVRMTIDSQINCSLPYQKKIVIIDHYGYLILADDYQTTAGFLPSSNYSIIVRERLYNCGSKFVDKRTISLPILSSDADVISISSDTNLLLVTTTSLVITVWDIDNDRLVCNNTLQQRYYWLAWQQVYFNPYYKIFYIINTDNFLSVFNLTDCSLIGKTNYTIQNLMMFKNISKIIITMSNPHQFIELDPVTLQQISKNDISTSEEQLLSNDKIFGCLQQNNSIFFVQYNNTLDITLKIKTEQILCSSITVGNGFFSFALQQTHYYNSETFQFIGGINTGYSNLFQTFQPGVQYYSNSNQITCELLLISSVTKVNILSNSPPSSSFDYYLYKNSTTFITLQAEANGSIFLYKTTKDLQGRYSSISCNTNINQNDIYLFSATLKYSCDKNYILFWYYLKSTGVSSLNIYDAQNLRFVYQYNWNASNQLGTFSDYGYYLDCQGFLIISSYNQFIIIDLKLSMTTNSQEIVNLTGPIAISNNLKYFYAVGLNQQNTPVIQLWNQYPRQFIESYTPPSQAPIDKLFTSLDGTVFFIMQNFSLYKYNTLNFILLMTPVVQCNAISNDSILCKMKDNSNQIINISTNGKTLSSLNENSSLSQISISPNLYQIAQYGQNNSISISNVQGSQLINNATISSPQSQVSLLALGGNNTFVTFSNVDKSAVVWQFTQCPTDQILSQNLCVCPSNSILNGSICQCDVYRVMVNRSCNCLGLLVQDINNSCLCMNNAHRIGSQCLCVDNSQQIGNQCVCNDGYISDSSSNSCLKCNQGYTSDSSFNVCQKCNFFCGTCSKSLGSCDSLSLYGWLIIGGSIVIVGTVIVVVVRKIYKKKIERRAEILNPFSEDNDIVSNS